MNNFKGVVEANFKGQRLKVLDVGSYGVNGTYREIFADPERYEYVGLDLTPGPNVDYVPTDPYRWKELKDESFDLIVSGQAFEHIEFPWLTILEMKRVLKKNGLICIIAPSRGPEHRYPVDCWRYYPDGFNALAKWAGLEVVEVKTNWGSTGFKDGSDQWGDSFCILRKASDNFPGNRVVDGTYLTNKVKRPINRESPFQEEQPGYYYSIARKEIIDIVVKYNLPSERVLEIGCAGGATGKLLKEKGNVKEYIGIDISEGAGLIARQHLDRVFIADIEKTDLERDFGIEKGSFDIILCLDVLEHLYNPWDVVANLREYLNDHGVIIASIPNIQNISIINNLINGRWNYEQAGLLDATHLRFFTLDGIKRMFEGANLKIERIERSLNPAPDFSKIKNTGNNIDLGKFMLKNLSRDEVMNLFTYQYILVASRAEIVKKNPIVRDDISFQKELTSIVILTYNQLEYTKRCVESIRRYTPEPHEIIFVDNGSKDGTVPWLRELIKENPHYRLIENKENRGFAAGCNQGIKDSKGEYILLLNNDVIVTEGWLSGLLDCLKREPQSGIVGPMTNNISGLQMIEVPYKNEREINDFAKAFRERYKGRRIPLRRIVGFCMLFRRNLIKEIGPLDETFGTGNFEDDDLCLRAEVAGYRNYIAGDVFIHHYGSRSFIGNRIDYNATMGGNRKRFNEKWNALSVDRESEEGKGILCLRIIERAEELYHKERFEDAIKAMLSALKIQPENRRILYTLAERLIELKQFDNCLEILKNYGDDDPMLSLLRGYCLEGLGRFDEAEALLNKQLSSHPMALNLRGIIHYRKGETDKAAEYFIKAIEADPGYGEPRTNLGVIRWASGNKAEAIELLERGVILSPGVPDLAELYHSAISQEGLYGRAEEVFKEVVRLNPLNKGNIFRLIDILLHQNSYEPAMDLIEKSIARFGVDDEFLKAALSVREKIGCRKIVKRPGSKTLSLCMIVKNEERFLPACLESVKGLVDEMVIVDTGSEDRTKEIAQVFGARVYEYPWTGDFSEARNLSLSKAAGDWILVLDADEVIAERDHAVIKRLINKNKKKIAYVMTTRNYMNRIVTGWKQNNGEYLEERGSGWMPSVKTRLFPNDRRLRFENPVHELLDYSVQREGYILKECPAPVHHYGKLNEKKTEEKFELYYELGKKKLDEAENRPKALYELAVQASEMGRLDEAARLWEELIELRPDIGPAYVSLSRVYCELRRFKEAVETSKKAVELASWMKEAHYARGLSEFYSDNIDESIKSLEQALKIDSDYPLPLGLLSLCYLRKGDKKRAKEYVERVRALGFDYPSFAHAIMDKLRPFMEGSQSANPGEEKA